MATVFQSAGDVTLTLTVWMAVMRRTVAVLLAVTVLLMSSSATTHYANLLLGNVTERTTVETTQMRIQRSAGSSSVLLPGLTAARTIVCACRCQRGVMVSITVETTLMKLTARLLQLHVRKTSSSAPMADASAQTSAVTSLTTVRTMALMRSTARQTPS